MAPYATCGPLIFTDKESGMPFVCSCNNHVTEPRTLWADNLPAKFRDQALRAEKKENYITVNGEGRELFRIRIVQGFRHYGVTKHGGFDIEQRLKDLALDGIDAEILYP